MTGGGGIEGGNEGGRGSGAQQEAFRRWVERAACLLEDDLARGEPSFEETAGVVYGALAPGEDSGGALPAYLDAAPPGGPRVGRNANARASRLVRSLYEALPGPRLSPEVSPEVSPGAHASVFVDLDEAGEDAVVLLLDLVSAPSEGAPGRILAAPVYVEISRLVIRDTPSGETSPGLSLQADASTDALAGLSRVHAAVASLREISG